MAQEQTIRLSDYSQTPTNVPKRGPPEECKPKPANYLESIQGAIQKLKSRCLDQVTEDSTLSDEDELCAEDSLEVRANSMSLVSSAMLTWVFFCDK